MRAVGLSPPDCAPPCRRFLAPPCCPPPWQWSPRSARKALSRSTGSRADSETMYGDRNWRASLASPDEGVRAYAIAEEFSETTPDLQHSPSPHDPQARDANVPRCATARPTAQDY